MIKSFTKLCMHACVAVGRQRVFDSHAATSSQRSCGSGCAPCRGRQAEEEEVSVLLRKANDGHPMQARQTLAPGGWSLLREGRAY